MRLAYKFIHKHPSRRLNQHLKVFFRNLKSVDRHSSFLPLSQYFPNDFVNHLNTAPELTAKFNSFFQSFKILSFPLRNAVIDLFYQSQGVEQILENLVFDGNSIKKITLPTTLRGKTSRLFRHLYKITLKSFGDLDNHYTQLYDSLPTKVCPFCGIELIQLPHFSRQDYDHIMCQFHYPFVATNMSNLVPMGDQCNRTYKKQKDVLYKGGHRRRFAYPYSRSYDIVVDLDGSILPNRSSTFRGTWVINFTPNDDFIETWEDVFKIRYRLGELILPIHFDTWLGYFIDNIKSRSISVTSQRELKRQFKIDAKLCLDRPFLEFNIVKGALFDYLSRCNDSNFYLSVIREINT